MSTETNEALARDWANAYAPPLSDCEARAIRAEHERRQRLIREWHADEGERKQHRRKASVVAAIVGSALVAGMFLLACMVIGARR